ncbi:hypothetical protein SUGI_0864890 [Cryptomeria japonica]|uniref:protein TOPLESS-like isoform X1 n=1 Tax=Cryptomeria japonica TaxID=3369 RepID=UPI002414CD29|nr:protein TOPLESS-like isoform X1 [Cryptomeria japonica]GLJ41790.1 hypothetical protein SUGI_0864890 [Cryptomeria japonica]
MAINLSSELLSLILQFLDEERLSETAHKLEQESGCYFNMAYFESQVLAGEWDKVEGYLSGFTRVRDNVQSAQTFFEIRKQKYLEALVMKDYVNAVEILRKDLKMFENLSSVIYKELTQLITLGNIRKNEKFYKCGDTTSTRKSMFLTLRRLINDNPKIFNKLKLPHIETSRLRILINQSLNWQHQICKKPTCNLDIRSLFLDHICVPLGGSQSHTNNSIVGVIPQEPFSHGVDLSSSGMLSLTTGWMENSEHSMSHPLVPVGTGNAGFLKRTRTPTANSTGTDYQFVSPVPVAKRSRIGPSDLNNSDSNRPTDVKQSVLDEDANKIKKVNLSGMSHSIHCRSLKLPDRTSKEKIVQLLYTNSGSNVLALDSNASHKRWIWTCNEENPTGKVTTTIPTGFDSATHDSCYKDPEKQISCMVLSNNDKYILSTFGGEVSLLRLKKFKPISILLPPSPPATSFALHPEDNNIVAFGLENSKILISNVKSQSAETLQGHHQKKITSLAFSLSLGLLISAGADGLLCGWSLDGYVIRREQIVYPHGERLSSPLGINKIQFHKNQVHLLVVQENQIAIYDSSTLEQDCYWEPHDSMAAPISSALYSCDSQLVYACFCDGAIGVFDADILRPLFRVPPSAYLPSDMSSDNIYPLAIATHPHECNQFAIGLTDGEAYLIDLIIESQGKEAMDSLENGVAGSDPSTSNHGSELPS